MLPNSVHNVAQIAHRDLKPENILIADHDEIKISDFGLGTQKITESNEQSGTRLFMPPEYNTFEGKKKNNPQPADIWALGVTLLIMLTGKLP